MEKFESFSDRGTGINPFVPYVESKSTKYSPQMNLLRYVCLFPIVAMKIFFFVCALCTLYVLEWIASMIPTSTGKRVFIRTYNFIIYRFMLLVCGFFSIREEFFLPLDANKKNMPKRLVDIYVLDLFTSLKQILYDDFNSGDLVICNHVSYFDVFYLSCRLSPVFVRPLTMASRSSLSLNLVGSESDVKVIKYTSPLMYFIDQFFFNKQQFTPVTEKSGEYLSDVVRFAKENNCGPVVVFPEGTTSNGRGILRYQKLFDDKLSKILSKTAPKSKVHIIGFKYIYQHFSPAFHIWSSPKDVLMHLLDAMYQIHNDMVVKIVDGVEDDNGEGMSNISVSGPKWSPLISRQTLANLVGPSLELNLDKKTEFTEYYLKNIQKK